MHTNRKADFAVVVYGLFVSAGAGRELWRSPIVPGKPNRLTALPSWPFFPFSPILDPEKQLFQQPLCPLLQFERELCLVVLTAPSSCSHHVAETPSFHF